MQRPEVELVLLAARQTLGREQTARLRALTADPACDWAFVWEWSGGHRVRGLVGRGLLAAAQDQLPDAVRRQLLADRRQRALDNLQQLQALLDLLAFLDERGIPAMPYKGVALGLLLYGEAGVRHGGDIDILLRKRDALQARDLLRAERGFRDILPLARLPDYMWPLYSRIMPDFAFIDPADGQHVELQWALVRDALAIPPHPDRLWERLDRQLIGDRPLPQFPPEELLLVLSVHAAKHLWHRLMWLCDIDALVQRQPALDWARAEAVAEAWGCRPITAATLRLTRDLLGTPLPAAAQWALGRPTGGEQAARRRILAGAPPHEQSNWAQFTGLWQLGATWRQKVRAASLLFGLKWPDIADLWIRPPWQCLYYVVRPLRLLRHGSRDT